MKTSLKYVGKPDSILEFTPHLIQDLDHILLRQFKMDDYIFPNDNRIARIREAIEINPDNISFKRQLQYLLDERRVNVQAQLQAATASLPPTAHPNRAPRQTPKPTVLALRNRLAKVLARQSAVEDSVINHARMLEQYQAKMYTASLGRDTKVCQVSLPSQR